MTDWSSRVVLVTGGASGIGRSTSLAFAAAGAAVAVVDRDPGGAETAGEIAGGGGRAIFVQADVSLADDVDSMVHEVVATFGRLDHAHNNAGIEGAFSRTVDVTEDDWDRVIAVNLKGVWLCMRSELRQMLEQGFGSIVNTASILGLVGFTHCAAYGAAKHGVVGLTKVAAVEFGARGVRVNAVCPGFTETPMLVQREASGRGLPSDFLGHVGGLTPAKRLGKPEEIADAVMWLCSDEASFVNGQALAVDGGYVAQ